MIPLVAIIAALMLMAAWFIFKKLPGIELQPEPPPADRFCVICGHAATHPWRKIRAVKSKQRIHGTASTYEVVNGEEHRLCEPHYRMIDSRLEQELSAARAVISETLTTIERRFGQLEMGELLTWAQVEAKTAEDSIDTLRNRELQPRQLTAPSQPPKVVILQGTDDES